MNKTLKKIIGDNPQRGESRYTRLLKADDDVVLKRSGSPSTEIADLVHKGLAYEALERGANDPVIRNLLRSLNDIVKHQVEETVRPLRDALHQNQLFIATLFLTLTAKLEFPLDNSDQQQLDELHEACATQANQMLITVLPPPPDDLLSAEPEPAQSTAA